MAGINYNDRIPNNVNLSSDRRLQRALEKWQPAFLDWWQSVGPQVFQNNDIFRTAKSTGDRIATFTKFLDQCGRMFY